MRAILKRRMPRGGKQQRLPKKLDRNGAPQQRDEKVPTLHERPVASGTRADVDPRPEAMLHDVPALRSKFIPRNMKFDLVIIDEASQMRPEDALGALLRARQIVVVGDPKQLPPTDFFNRVVEDQDEDEERTTSRTKSILEACSKSFNRLRSLKWHYRSRCESLIDFSNREFYEKSLITFPMARPGLLFDRPRPGRRDLRGKPERRGSAEDLRGSHRPDAAHGRRPCRRIRHHRASSPSTSHSGSGSRRNSGVSPPATPR